MQKKCISIIKSEVRVYLVNGREYYNYSKGFDVNLFPYKRIVLPIKEEKDNYIKPVYLNYDCDMTKDAYDKFIYEIYDIDKNDKLKVKLQNIL